MTYPELAGEGGRARLVWPLRSADHGPPKLLSSCPPWLGPRLETFPEELQGDAARAWTRRWQRLLSCAAAKAFVQSLLDVVPSGSDGRTPSVHEVICDDRFFC